MFSRLNYQYLLSYFGLIPYFLILIDKYFLNQIKEQISINFLIYYTLIIFVFIGSINWNFDNKTNNFITIYGFLPSFFATFIIILNLYSFNFFYLILIINLLLVTQLIFDYFVIFLRKPNKNFLYFLRIPLTLSIILSLLIFII